MKTEEFKRRLEAIKTTVANNEARLEEFESRCCEKLKELARTRDEVVEQLKQCYTPEKGSTSAECTDGGVTYIVNYSAADLRDKQNRDLITVTVRDRSDGAERGNSAQTNMLVTLVDTGVIDTINDARRVAEEVAKIERFVTLADRAVNHYLNWMQNASNQQSDFLHEFIDGKDEGYW